MKIKFENVLITVFAVAVVYHFFMKKDKPSGQAGKHSAPTQKESAFQKAIREMKMG